MGDIGNHGVCSATGGRGYLWPRRLELLGAGLVIGTFRFLVGPYPLALVLFGQVNELQEKKLQESCAGRLCQEPVSHAFTVTATRKTLDGMFLFRILGERERPHWLWSMGINNDDV